MKRSPLVTVFFSIPWFPQEATGPNGPNCHFGFSGACLVLPPTVSYCRDGCRHHHASWPGWFDLIVRWGRPVQFDQELALRTRLALPFHVCFFPGNKLPTKNRTSQSLARPAVVTALSANWAGIPCLGRFEAKDGRISLIFLVNRRPCLVNMFGYLIDYWILLGFWQNPFHDVKWSLDFDVYPFQGEPTVQASRCGFTRHKKGGTMVN